MGCFVIAIFVTSQIIDKLQLKSYGVAVMEKLTLTRPSN